MYEEIMHEHWLKKNKKRFDLEEELEIVDGIVRNKKTNVDAVWNSELFHICEKRVRNLTYLHPYHCTGNPYYEKELFIDFDIEGNEFRLSFEERRGELEISLYMMDVDSFYRNYAIYLAMVLREDQKVMLHEATDEMIKIVSELPSFRLRLLTGSLTKNFVHKEIVNLYKRN